MLSPISGQGQEVRQLPPKKTTKQNNRPKQGTSLPQQGESQVKDQKDDPWVSCQDFCHCLWFHCFVLLGLESQALDTVGK